MSKIRFRINIPSLEKKIEVIMSKELTLKENMELVFEMLGYRIETYILMPRQKAIALDLDIAIKDIGLLDGASLYLYDFTNL